MDTTNDLILEFDDETLNDCIPARFAAIARKFANRPAVIHDAQRISYAALDIASSQVAHWLLAQKEPPEKPVALLFGLDIPVIIALLGVLKAGRIVCALEPFVPEQRNAVLLEDLQSPLILTEPAYLAQASLLAGENRRAVDIISAAVDQPVTDPQRDISPHTSAVISFTSGSTGTPKGVLKSHAYYVRRAALNAQFHGTKADDVISLLTFVSHGSGLIDLFDALLTGAALCIYDLRNRGPLALTGWILEHGVTQLHLPSSALRIWSESMAEDVYLATMRCLRPTMRLHAQDIAPLWKHLPATAFIVHGLSTAETGVVSRLKLHADTPLDSDIIPLGYPLPGVEILLMDEAGQPAVAGEAGEIWVRSPFLAGRYWRRPELTSDKFIADPRSGNDRICRLGDWGRLRPDGCLELIGRKDFQVKIRGYRVELEEVEIALEQFETVRDAVVVAKSNQWGEQRLVAYVVPAGQAAVTAQSLREFLRQQLPAYMIPSQLVLLDALPLLPNGKVNRRALPAPGDGRPDLDTPFVAPRTPTEVGVAAILKELLPVDRLGVNDNLLDLGLHSLLAARAASRIIQAFGVDLPVSLLFESPTAAEIALEITQRQAAQLDRDSIEQLLSELENPAGWMPSEQV